jgi:hypothetical protein
LLLRFGELAFAFGDFALGLGLRAQGLEEEFVARGLLILLF